MTEHNPAPSPSGHPLLSGPPTLPIFTRYIPEKAAHAKASRSRTSGVVRRIKLPPGVGRPASGVLGPDAGCRTPSGVRYPGRVPGTLYVRHDGRGANRDHTVKDHEPRDEGADLVNSQLTKRSHTSS
eukprot:scaffold113111_cov62-Phaeocystis_antarctica.AAC.1